jgi:creatinine amidohydrolase
VAPDVERRYERLRPAELRALVAHAPVAWVPIGTLEWHGEHLPFGVDGFEAHAFCLRAAARAGGVVLPPTYLASGVLALDFSLRYDLELVARTVAATLDELARAGFRVVVVLTGHGPLDLDHALKRVCAEAERRHAHLIAYGLCWLELNAALLGSPQTGEPEVVDHAALVETSYMLAIEPELVALERLPDDPDAAALGVYGRNPRFTASAEWGEASLARASELLAGRVLRLQRGQRLDTLADLRRFVELCWPERLELAGRAGPAGVATLELTNPGRSSRFLTGLAIELDGEMLAGVELANDNPGEGTRALASALGPEAGFYVRREQTALAMLPRAVATGPHRVTLRVGLGGVTEESLDRVVEFR